MKHRYTTLALLLSLFSASFSFGQNGTPKKPASKASFDRYPVSGMLYKSDSIRYYYDAEGRNTAIYGWSFNADNGGNISRRKVDRVYDPNGNLLSELTQGYRDTQGWVDSYKKLYTYDTNNHLLTALNQYYRDSSGWVNEYRVFLTYDAAGNKLSSLVETWKDSIWILNNALYFTYDAAGHVLTRTTDEGHRITYTYDGPGTLLSEIYMSYEFGIWKPSTRILYIYGFVPAPPAFGRMYQTWNGNYWDTYYKQDYSYNAAGDLTDILLQYKSGSGWLNGYLDHYEYNEHHQEVFNEHKEWENNTWAKHTRYFTTYDQDSDEVLWRRMQWNGAWYEVSLTRFHYDESLPTHAPQPNDFLLFPNPANDVVSLKGENLLRAEIFDLKGSLMASVDVLGETEKIIPLGNFPSGNYVTRLVGKDGKFSTKSLMVRH